MQLIYISDKYTYVYDITVILIWYSSLFFYTEFVKGKEILYNIPWNVSSCNISNLHRVVSVS